MFTVLLTLDTRPVSKAYRFLASFNTLLPAAPEGSAGKFDAVNIEFAGSALTTPKL